MLETFKDLIVTHVGRAFIWSQLHNIINQVPVHIAEQQNYSLVKDTERYISQPFTPAFFANVVWEQVFDTQCHVVWGVDEKCCFIAWEEHGLCECVGIVFPNGSGARKLWIKLSDIWMKRRQRLGLILEQPELRQARMAFELKGFHMELHWPLIVALASCHQYENHAVQFSLKEQILLFSSTEQMRCAIACLPVVEAKHEQLLRPMHIPDRLYVLSSYHGCDVHEQCRDKDHHGLNFNLYGAPAFMCCTCLWFMFGSGRVDSKKSHSQCHIDVGSNVLY
ncbi:MAG: hypothetical protein K0U52_08315 [Gammaproteobacteria bacterium]|nr:hypothetical protein [Gammaproteobacteria bacterium]